MAVTRALEFLRRARADDERGADRRQDPEGDPRAAGLPRRRRPRLPALDRARATLSGGEAQRIRLATQIGSRAGGRALHPRRAVDRPAPARQRAADRARSQRLRDLGNTVLVVEHDEETIRAADYLIDLGPGAGVHGGEVVAEGTVDRRSTRTRARSRRSTSRGRARDRGPPSAGAADRGWFTSRRAREQPQERRRRDPARPVRLRHRRVRLGQVARSSTTSSTRRSRTGSTGRATKPGAHDSHRRARAHRQGHRHRPVADRPHAALEPGDLHRALHHDPRALRRRPRRRCAATGRAGSPST